MKFEPIVPNPDIDVHPDPPGLWEHVAVICRWKDAKAQRKQWPHASVIGPLRTVRGLDELARNLLHNPQIRVVLVVGNDQTEGEETTEALLALWQGKPEGEKHIGEEVRGPFWDVQVHVDLVPPDHNAGDPPHPSYLEFLQRRGRVGTDMAEWRASAQFPVLPAALVECIAADAARPKVTLPPPPPSANATAPSGDPGERVVGETLADLWPAVLHRAMRFGAQRPTHYGPTRELLCLVGVVRDVEKSVGALSRWGSTLAEVKRSIAAGAARQGVDLPALSDPDWKAMKHPVLQISYAQAEGYRKRISQAEVPEGAPYSYGSRMRGQDLPHKPYRVASGLRPTDPTYKVIYDEDCCERTPSCIRSRGHGGSCDREEWWENEKNLKLLNEENDQITAVEALLREKPDTRAAYVTPWRPAEDAGKESGRPCMVGAWFRVEATGCGRRDCNGCARCTDKNGSIIPGGQHGRLHLVVAFRSHDLFAAYPMNLAGLLLWQVETARKLGMRPGSLTVTSYSAHVYERDWNAAEVVIKQHYEEARREPQWDQRSSWHVELIPPVIVEKPVEVGEVLQVPRSASGVLDTWEVQAEPAGPDMIVVENQTSGERVRILIRQWRENRGDYRGPQPKPTLRATALTPDGREVLGVFSAETAESLRSACERSGLVTSIGAALWLGDEIRKVAGRAS